jgi:AcrR family transcriptional regulator
MVRSSTRDDILAAAAQLFAATGFKGTSLHDIAVEVGCSKATLLYHFATKDAILVALLAPPRQAMVVLDEKLSALDSEAARLAAIDGFVDLILAYRSEIALIYQDLIHVYRGAVFAEILPLIERLMATLAGRSADPADLVGAKVVMAGLATVALDQSGSDDDMRALLVGVARRALIQN